MLRQQTRLKEILSETHRIKESRRSSKKSQKKRHLYSLEPSTDFISNFSTTAATAPHKRSKSSDPRSELMPIRANPETFKLSFNALDFKAQKKRSNLAFSKKMPNNPHRDPKSRQLFSTFEKDIEDNLKILGLTRKNFEYQGPTIINRTREAIGLVEVKLTNLLRVLRFRKCKEILQYSLELCDIVIQTELPNLVVTSLDYLIPILQNFNEITLIKKYTEVMMRYGRLIPDQDAKMRASEFKGYYFRKNGWYDKALKRYFKMLHYALLSRNREAELRSYSLIGMCYYYMGRVEKSIPFERRSIMGVLEPDNSRLRTKRISDLEGNFIQSDSEGEEITLNDPIQDNNAPGKKVLDMTPGQRLSYLRNFRQMRAKYIVKKYEKDKRIVRLPGIMRRMHKEKNKLSVYMNKRSESYEEAEARKLKGSIWDDKRIITLTHLSPYRNKTMHDAIAQRRSKSFRSQSLKKKGEINTVEFKAMTLSLNKIAFKIKSIKEIVDNIELLYAGLENSYCVPMYFYEAQMRKGEKINQRMLREAKRLEKKLEKEARAIHSRTIDIKLG